ncbi:MAG: MBL fold metallo-hydrolase [Calditrichaeota bacterium]|nr:MAG: MBL fold metallo-hydrolase [Calditrichota bacterium]
MDKQQMKVKVYGARGSYSPVNGEATQFGVNTTCFRIDVGETILIFDAGSGIIPLGQDLVKEFFAKDATLDNWVTHLFFTHMHIDHLIGFPYFAMLYLPKSVINFISPRILDYDLKDVLDMFVHPPFFPVSLHDLPVTTNFYHMAEKYVVYFFEDNTFEIKQATEPAPEKWIARVQSIRNFMHPKGGSFFYKITSAAGRKVVIASDTEGFLGGDQRLVKFAEEADLLLHDAQYTFEEYQKFQGFGHSTYHMACEVAKQARVKKLLLIHHDPSHSDETLKQIEKAAQEIFPETYVASESMEFTF